ncbi:MAG: Holliday junction resolvase RuvX, partial [Gammaproteobacteria bacterium]|nr:Holliday junction resolvase RuvX [Gammaproteobacteria bacterium]
MPGTPDATVAETILAFDYGRRRIGVAVGQTITASASPLGVIRNNAAGADLAKIAALIREWRPNRLIVGLPMHADGSTSELQHVLDAFIDQLKAFALPIDTVDERYTSLEAEAELRQARARGARGRISRQQIDSTAAVLIAE